MVKMRWKSNNRNQNKKFLSEESIKIHSEVNGELVNTEINFFNTQPSCTKQM